MNNKLSSYARSQQSSDLENYLAKWRNKAKLKERKGATTENVKGRTEGSIEERNTGRNQEGKDAKEGKESHGKGKEEE